MHHGPESLAGSQGPMPHDQVDVLELWREPNAGQFTYQQPVDWPPSHEIPEYIALPRLKPVETTLLTMNLLGSLAPSCVWDVYQFDSIAYAVATYYYSHSEGQEFSG